MEKIKKGETMSFAVTINSSGQATIPKEVRDILGIIPGQNRLTFDIVDGKISLGKEKSRAELLEESLQKIWEMNEELAKKDPVYAKNREKYKGMSFEEVRDAYDATPEGKKEFKEKYGFKI